MIKKYLIPALLIISFISCKKGSTKEYQPVNPVSIQPAETEVPATIAFIAVVNSSGDTIQSNPVRITVLN